MKKSFVIIIPGLVLSLFVSVSIVAAAGTASSTVEINPVSAPEVLASTTSSQGSSTAPIVPPVAPPVAVNPGAVMAQPLPDFQIEAVTIKASETDSKILNYYATIVNRGSDFIITSNSLGLSFRNASNDNNAENSSYFAVGTAGDTFAREQKMNIGPLLPVLTGSRLVRVVINPLLTVAEKKYDNNYFEQEVADQNSTSTPFVSTSTSSISTSTLQSTSTAPVAPKVDIKKEALLVSQSGSSVDKLTALVKELKVVRNNQLMTDNLKKFTEILRKQFPKEAIAKIYAINNFVTYGTPSTVKLAPKDRFNLVSAFVKTNKKLPSSETDWAKVLTAKK
jgi:hypothetical protein